MPARGTHVDRYELESLIGMGGMAEVWVARHRVLGVRRALKFILSDAGSSSSIGDALVREGQLQARLDHPNVLAVLDVLHHEAHPVLVLPLVQGPPMSELLKERPPSLEEGAALMLGVLEGVHAAHAAGVVHRDLKPGNVLLAVRYGRVVPRVADFGIAGAAKGMGWAAGTPPYAPPEQFDGRIVDVEADFFAIGVMLREIVTGSATGDLSEVPSALQALILGLISPAPETRCASVSDVRDVLEALADPDALGLGSSVAEWVGQREWAAPASGATLAAEATSATFPGASTGVTLAPPAHLPRFRDVFVGRASLIQHATQQLSVSTGLVTLVGPGGVGKTRVAVELAHKASLAYSGGTWFIDWSETVDREGAALTMAQALGLQLSGADLRDDRLVDAVGEGIGALRPCLLVVDNVEQLGEVCQQLLGRWLTLAPDARFLVTSRESVGLRGESRVEVLPLEAPTPTTLGDAAELLIQRIRQVQPNFERTEENATSIQRIVMLTDGLPLAIELAAARVRLLGVDALADRLNDQLRVLSSRSGERPSRQRTLRSTLDWSWDLLDSFERVCLAQLSVFEGVFTVEAAEEIVKFDGDDPPWVDDVLMGLVEKSLVVCRVPAGERAPRLTLLRTVKQYAAEKLGNLAAGALGRHGVFYCRLGQDEPSDTLDVHGGEVRRQEWTRCLADVLAATRRAIQGGDGLLAGAGARTSWAILCIKGPFSLGIQLLREAIQVPSCTSHGVRLDLGRALWREGQLEEAREVLQSVLLRAQTDQDVPVAASAGAVLGGLLWATGQNAESRIVLDEASELAESSGMKRRLGVIEGNRMVLCVLEGDSAAGLELGQRAIALHEAVGDTRSLARATMNMGVLAIRMGELDRAEAYLRQAVGAQSQMGNRHGLMFATGNLARLLLNRGQLDVAREQARRAARLAVEVGDRGYLSRFLNVRAEIEAKAGDGAAARKALRRSQRALRDEDGPISRAFVSLAAAWVAVVDQDWQQADDALSEADRLTQDQPADGVIRSDLQQTREAVDRARLGPESPETTIG